MFAWRKLRPLAGWFGSWQRSPVSVSRGKPRLRCELLESRNLLSASGIAGLSAAPTDLLAPMVTNNSVYGYTPAQIRHAYGFDQVTFSGGVVGNGAGQTIAIVDAYDDPNIASDLAVFDAKFGIAAPPKFTKVSQTGGTKFGSVDAGWALETSLDVEWAHAIAPGANILLVEANTSSLTDLLAAVKYAASQTGVSVVSMSWGSGEFSSETAYDSYFTTPKGHTGVTFVASSGDNGAPTSWPAVSPNVMSVGGTSLHLGSGGVYSSETGWSGSGGGLSQYETEPGYQSSALASKYRGNPDVGYDADPNTGFAVYDTVTIQKQSGWFELGGTSAGAPQWAALIAIADQGRAKAGLAALSGAQANIYALPQSDFHDVTSGSNGYSAGANYDLVTGRGSPYANLVIRDLISPPTKVTYPAAYAPPTKAFGGHTFAAHAVLNDGGSAGPTSTPTVAVAISWSHDAGSLGGAVAWQAATGSYDAAASGGPTWLATRGSSNDAGRDARDAAFSEFDGDASFPESDSADRTDPRADARHAGVLRTDGPTRQRPWSAATLDACFADFDATEQPAVLTTAKNLLGPAPAGVLPASAEESARLTLQSAGLALILGGRVLPADSSDRKLASRRRLV